MWYGRQQYISKGLICTAEKGVIECYISQTSSGQPGERKSGNITIQTQIERYIQKLSGWGCCSVTKQSSTKSLAYSSNHQNGS